MDWDKLRIFQAVADAGSFTHAGESLKLSQSAISRQIGALEEQLGVMLFHRHARGLILTEQGELEAIAGRLGRGPTVRSRLDHRDRVRGGGTQPDQADPRRRPRAGRPSGKW